MASEEVYLWTVATHIFEVPGKVFDDRHRAMSAAGTTNTQGKVRLALGSVARDKKGK